MRVQFIISCDNASMDDIAYWCELPVIPIRGQYVNVKDFLPKKDYTYVLKKSLNWNGYDAQVSMPTLRKDKYGWYYYVCLHCENPKN